MQEIVIDEIEINEIEDDPTAWQPGTIGFHEALHVSGLVQTLLDNEVLHHPAVRHSNNNQTQLLAQAAFDAVAALYQHLGSLLVA